jgi:hypothetical protein
MIGKRIVAAIKPRSLQIGGYFHPRGGDQANSCHTEVLNGAMTTNKMAEQTRGFQQAFWSATMSLRELMLHDLAGALAIVRDGREVVPAWRILTPEGDFLILTRFDPDKPDQRERMLALVPRFMAWKLATAFVLTADTWLGPEWARSGEEAVLVIGVSRTERMSVIRRIRRTPGLVFMPPEWLRPEALDENYFRLLPSGPSNVTTEEATMLAAMFGEGGELPARRLN